MEGYDGFPEDTHCRTGGTGPCVATWDKGASTLTVCGLRLTRLKAGEGPFELSLHAVLTRAKSIFPALNTDPDAFERVWKTALRAVDGLGGPAAWRYLFFAENLPGYRAVVSQLWSNTPAPAVEAFLRQTPWQR